ncbi:MAG: RHS repeat-associated core domain-containing protein, partial [Lachnospiraceae bacterium]|nr:RHS repeat-associated core domain-containing protein [Lachnospiraceae bacterium]
RLLTYNGENIKYDKDGNMTYGPLAGEMTAFVYDCRNRLIQAGDTRYIYDAENNRIGVETDKKKTTYVINTQPELSQVLQSTETKIDENDNKENTITTHYFYGNGLNAQDNGKDYFVYHFNNVGSTMVVTDSKGDIVETYNYTPYGELIDGEYREDILFLYNGQYGVVTDNNGLYYMRARYYNVEIKRFINQDVLLGVLERISSLNRYAYVEGNPVSYLDPFGLAIETVQKIVSTVSVVISGLKLLRLVAPEAWETAEKILAVAAIFLDIIQLCKYGADEDRVNDLKRDIFLAVFDNIIPEINTMVSLFEKRFGESIITISAHNIFNTVIDYMEDAVKNIVNIIVTASGA